MPRRGIDDSTASFGGGRGRCAFGRLGFAGKGTDADASADPQPGFHAFLTEQLLPRQATVIEVGDLAGVLD